jgi:hypothetical protein
MNDFFNVLSVIAFAGIPVISLDGLTRIGQNIIAMTQRVLTYGVVIFIANLIFKACTTPLFLVAAVAAINLAPDVIRWLWIKMGALCIDFCVTVYGIFAPATNDMIEQSPQLARISQLYQAAQTNLPTEINDMLCFLGVHELIGMIISYWVFRGILRIVLNIQNRVMAVSFLETGRWPV